MSEKVRKNQISIVLYAIDNYIECLKNEAISEANKLHAMSKLQEATTVLATLYSAEKKVGA